ncbi:small nucleolar ribonucleoprotein complex [Grosmannia clavigera kw1407]|uniref:U three protein 7 n=1 Tax=Grosmannia clavigera (strain kw1407 / UAMH 11150) TaxID=655863 RepID=F0X806_GROCL|nr:small nucleolar ribonucleoprotein complex [Grosmannia clavigera kw1407]EFX06341.1 small nucleolar ribonucleoprotein complex [Grosmannia clavigera kw1407]
MMEVATTTTHDRPRKKRTGGAGSAARSGAGTMVKHNNGAKKVDDLRLSLRPKEEQERIRRHKEAQSQYGRGKQIPLKAVQDRKLKRTLGNLESRYKRAVDQAKDAEVLLENASGFLEAETDLERTYKVRQDEIVKEAPIAVAQKRFDLKLDQLGPYMCEFTRTGRELLLAGRKGHVATMDWREGKLGCELQLGETIRDIRWLHNNQYFAVAQKKHVYIYDRNGVELHCMRKHIEVSHMEFLPYHFLLSTISLSGQLKYQDVTTGNLVSEIHTKTGAPCSFTQNPYNAVVHAGHQNGTVTLWSPNSSEPLVKLLAHRGPVRALGVDRQGRYMVSGGQDCRMSVWDIRMFKGEVGNYHTHHPVSSISISDSGVVATGHATRTTLWKGILTGPVEEKPLPYMKWGGDGKAIERVRFCPFEDVLGVSHNMGFSSLIVPGAGEANFDALEVNPYETVKQRQEGEVKALLNKLQPEMIALDPNFVGKLDERSEAQRQADRDLDAVPVDIGDEIRNKMRGKNTALKKYIRKQRKKNIIDEKRLKVDEIWKEQQKRKREKLEEAKEDLGPALGRFARKE